MVIKPLLPVPPPELGEAPSLRMLPFRGNSNFLELLKAAGHETVSVGAGPSSHKVRPGESLWRICESALKTDGVVPAKSEINAAVHRIAAANRLKDADVLSVGQKLDLTTLRGIATSGPQKHHGKAEQPSMGVTGELNNVTARTKPTALDSPDWKTLRAPLAALIRPVEGPIGGGSPITRPLFHRLSNARPPIHAHPRQEAIAEEAIASAKSVDLTALMQSILEPGSLAPLPQTETGPWSKLLAGAGRFTSGFGLRGDPFSGKPQFHQGIDIAAPTGTEIYPYMPGTVKSAGWDPGHGKMVVIEHPNGMETVYAHASETLVKTGDVVLKDTPIAKVGSTGRSTGSHLHFEVRQNNKAVDPLPLVTKESLDVAKAF